MICWNCDSTNSFLAAKPKTENEAIFLTCDTSSKIKESELQQLNAFRFACNLNSAIHACVHRASGVLQAKTSKIAFGLTNILCKSMRILWLNYWWMKILKLYETSFDIFSIEKIGNSSWCDVFVDVFICCQKWVYKKISPCGIFFSMWDIFG